jgi:hypothetical protein
MIKTLLLHITRVISAGWCAECWLGGAYVKMIKKLLLHIRRVISAGWCAECWLGGA